MDAAPYDNVEFPIRRPQGTGTWPSSNIVLPIKHVSPKGPKLRQEPKLSPVLENEGLEVFESYRDATGGPTQGALVAPQAKETTVTIGRGVQLINNSLGNQTTDSSSMTVNKSASMPATFEGLPPRDTRTPFVVLEQSRDNDKRFCDMDLVPASQTILENAYAMEQKFNRLHDVVLSQAEVMRQDVWEAKSRPGEMMTYEQLLQGMLTEGEMLLLGGSWLHFSHLEFLDTEGKTEVKPSIGKGRLCLTNQRLLILSADITSDASLRQLKDLNGKEGYKLSVAKYNSVYYQNIPLGCFLNVEMASMVGNAKVARITQRKPCCCGLCACFGIGCCGMSWATSPTTPVVINKRLLRLGVSMPPWQTRTLIVVYLTPEMPLTYARDFVAEIQNHAPLLH